MASFELSEFEAYRTVLVWVIATLKGELDIDASPDTDLQNGEIELDSLDKTTLLVAAEEGWAIDLGTEPIEREVWQTPSTIARMIASALA